VAELAHEYPPKIKCIVIPKRRYGVLQSSHTNSYSYAPSPYSTPFDSNNNNNNSNHPDNQHIRNRYLMLLEKEKNRTDRRRSPSPPVRTIPPPLTTRLSTIFKEASNGKPGFPPVPLSSSYNKNPLRIIAISDRESARDILPPSSIHSSSRNGVAESDNRNSRLGSIESSVETLLRKRRLECDESGGENDKLGDWEVKRFREESDRLVDLIDFIKRRDDSLGALARGSGSMINDTSDSEDEETDPLKSDLIKYENHDWADEFVHSDEEEEDEDDYNEDENEVIPYSAIYLGNREHHTEESSSSGSEDGENFERRNTSEIQRSNWDNNSDSESDEER